MYKRHRARVHALQALYQWDLNPISVISLIEQFHQNQDQMKRIDMDYFQSLVKGCLRYLDDIDQHFSPYLQIKSSKLDPTERGILRLSTYELKHCIAVPRRVVINEGVRLSKIFGAEGGYKLVNSVLDKVASDLRQDED